MEPTSRNTRLGAIAFSLLSIALAGYHRVDAKFDMTSIGLVLLAGLPWLLPMLAPLVSTLKVAGMELTFREMKQQIEENKQIAQATAAALVTGVGRAPAAVASVAAPPVSRRITEEGVSHGVPMPRLNEEEGEADASEVDAGDPNAGRFGGAAERSGRRLRAEVKAMPGSADLFLIHAWVSASDGARPPTDGTTVTFHLHPTYGQDVVKVPVSGGVAALDRIAWGAFTIGVEVEGIKLELNLADVAGAPDLFRQR